MKFPALYAAASRASDNSQRAYLRLIKMEYSFLIFAAVLSLEFSDSPTYYCIYAFVFLCPLVILLYRSTTKPEQNWYRARALAESIKTSSWRYAMRSEPYGLDQPENQTRAEFRGMLKEILLTNDQLGDQFGDTASADEQVTSDMDTLRQKPYLDRRMHYQEHRILDQRSWYAAKAEANRRMARLWPLIGAAIYAAAIASVLARIVYTQWHFWPTEPLTVAAASAVGWVQTKKFRELATSYALTAQEIGIMESRLSDVSNEIEFINFVNDAEQGFSREHTQWIARQQFH